MTPIDVDEIRRQMALIRREMHTDVANVVSDVEDAMDWRSPIRNHPYVAIGAGLIAGYFLVPRRKTKAQRVQQALASVPAEALADVIPRIAPVSKPAPVKSAKPAPSKSLGRQLTSWVVGMAWPLVSQSAQAYAAMWLESQLKQQLNPNPGPPPGTVPPSSSGRPGEAYDGRAARAARRG